MAAASGCVKGIEGGGGGARAAIGGAPCHDTYATICHYPRILKQLLYMLQIYLSLYPEYHTYVEISKHSNKTTTRIKYFLKAESKVQEFSDILEKRSRAT